MSTGYRFLRFAPKAARFVLTQYSEDLPKARILGVQAPVTVSDGGAGGSYTIAVAGATSSTRGVVKLAGQLGGTADSPTVCGILITGGDVGEGPQALEIGDVKDGEVLVRSGTTLIGASVLTTSGGGMSGDIDMSGNKVTGLASGTEAGDAATYGQLSAMLSGLDWQDSVIDRDLATPPGSPTTGDRYLVAASPSGAWSGKATQIATRTSAAWNFTVPTTGMTIHVDDEGIDLNWNGSAWVNLGSSVDHSSLLNLTSGHPHTQYQLGSQKDQNNGYAGVDSSGFIALPVKIIRTVSDPGSPNSGEVWINSNELKYRDASGSPATQVVERLSRRNQANGYAGLNGSSRLDPAQAPVKGVYSSGGDQALAPGDIGASPTSRTVSTSTGLTGGGDLTANRTLSIASFTGLVSKDVDPGSLTWSGSETKVHLTIDVGPNGYLIPIAVRLPPTVANSLRTEAVFKFDDNSTLTLMNGSDSNPLDETMQGIGTFLAGDLTIAASNNGRQLQQILLQTRNNTGGTVSSIDIGSFKVRAWALPRGGGTAL